MLKGSILLLIYHEHARKRFFMLFLLTIYATRSLNYEPYIYLCFMLSPTKPSPVKFSSWTFRCLAMPRGISSWHTHQTFQDWHIRNPSWWRHEDKTSRRFHKPSVPHYPPDMSQFHPGPGPRRPLSRGSFLDRPGHSGRDWLRELGPVEDNLEPLHRKQVGPSLWSSIWYRHMVPLRLEEDTPDLQTLIAEERINRRNNYNLTH